MEKDYYTIREASKAINCTPKTIRNYIRKGVLKASLEMGNTGTEYHIKTSDLKDFIENKDTGKIVKDGTVYKNDVIMAGKTYKPAWIINKLEEENKRLTEQLRERENHIAKLQAMNIRLNEEVLKRLPPPEPQTKETTQEPHKEKPHKKKPKKWYEFWK